MKSGSLGGGCWRLEFLCLMLRDMQTKQCFHECPHLDKKNCEFSANAIVLLSCSCLQIKCCAMAAPASRQEREMRTPISPSSQSTTSDCSLEAGSVGTSKSSTLPAGTAGQSCSGESLCRMRLCQCCRGGSGKPLAKSELLLQLPLRDQRLCLCSKYLLKCFHTVRICSGQVLTPPADLRCAGRVKPASDADGDDGSPTSSPKAGREKYTRAVRQLHKAGWCTHQETHELSRGAISSSDRETGTVQHPPSRLERQGLEQQAFQLAIEAAQQDHTPAQMLLASMYLQPGLPAPPLSSAAQHYQATTDRVFPQEDPGAVFQEIAPDLQQSAAHAGESAATDEQPAASAWEALGRAWAGDAWHGAWEQAAAVTVADTVVTVPLQALGVGVACDVVTTSGNHSSSEPQDPVTVSAQVDVTGSNVHAHGRQGPHGNPEMTGVRFEEKVSQAGPADTLVVEVPPAGAPPPWATSSEASSGAGSVTIPPPRSQQQPGVTFKETVPANVVNHPMHMHKAIVWTARAEAPEVSACPSDSPPPAASAVVREKEAFYWYQQAARGGNAHAMKRAGDLHSFSDSSSLYCSDHDQGVWYHLAEQARASVATTQR